MGLFRGKSIKDASSVALKPTEASEVEKAQRPALSTLFSEQNEGSKLQDTSKEDLRLDIRNKVRNICDGMGDDSFSLSPVSGMRGLHLKDVERFGNHNRKFSDNGLRPSRGSGIDAAVQAGLNSPSRRTSIKKSLSRRFTRSENRLENLPLKPGKGLDTKHLHTDSISPVSELSMSSRSTTQSVSSSNDMAEEGMMGPRLFSGKAVIEPSRTQCSNAQRNRGNLELLRGTCDDVDKDDDFEKAYEEDDVFLVEEATRRDFDLSRAEEFCLETQSASGAGMLQGNQKAQAHPSPNHEENCVGPMLSKQPNKPRKRPPPLMKAMTSESSEPSSDFPHTGVFGNDGGFTTGGFRITAEGMVNNGPLVTREDSEVQIEGGIPQSNRHLVVVKALSELRLGPTIGAGAAGRVCLAEHLPSQKTMAVKIVNVYDKQKRTQLLKELHTLATYVSRYLVRFYGAFYDGSGAVHITLEYMDHGCLSSFVEKVGAIPEEIVQMIATDCLGGLRFLHRHHVLHRDFKTANILLSRRLCCAKVSDFGLARDLNPGVSKVDTFVGTVAYMSPERLQGSEYTYASDIWALGVSVAECLLGTYPFGRPQNYFDYIEATTNGNMLECGKNGKRFSAGALDFVKMCTSTDPKCRLTAKELLEHPWISEAKRDNHLFGSWLDECRIISMRTPGKAKKNS